MICQEHPMFLQYNSVMVKLGRLSHKITRSRHINKERLANEYTKELTTFVYLVR